ncbi:MAG: HPr(Ser) kinase/phosphatase [Candidatus Aminicenantes bacterium]|nr:HPr(Ser) kinase/phosphatase [Acidobacteriota bacterium]MCG2810220.1 HPr(Ser) kinase/phosphatase [Candidatus Aminicenantes bacterium]
MPKDIKGVQLGQIQELSQLKIVRIFNEKWIHNLVSHPRPQRPGLGLTGYLKHIQAGRIQVFGKTEVGYLHNLKDEERSRCLKNYFSLKLPGIIISENIMAESDWIAMAARYGTPILISELHTAPLISRLNAFLYQYFSKKIKMNGVLMDIMGQGVLITGASGIGKSETALELVNKGYQLIADDVAEFYLDSNDDLIGRANEIIKNLMEVRGLGIININDIFGTAAILEEKKLNLAINLEKWDTKKKYDRLGEDTQYFKILGLEIPLITLPVGPGRNLSTIIEVAVRNFLAKKSGKKTYLELKKESAGPEEKSSKPKTEVSK